MIELDGRSYIVNTPTENAFALLEYVNQFMVDNNVKNSKGAIVQFKISLASPIWLLIIGIGYIATICQKIMYAVAQAFNIADCSEQQVLSLSKIARLPRKLGSYTTVACTATASASGPCHITTDMIAKATYEGVEYTFNPIYKLDIAAGTSEEVILICTVTGPVYFEIGAITALKTAEEEAVPNLDTFVSGAPQPGSGLESISSLRTRIMTNEAISPLAGATQGLNALDGVTKAVVLYNSNYDSDMILGGKTVPPKKAVVFVQGYSDKIAKEYYTHMTAQTYSDGTAHQQSYVMENGQNFLMNYFAPIAVNLYVKVKISTLITLERQAEIKQAVIKLSNSRNIGDNYTTSYMIDMLNTNLYFPEVTDIKISTDGVTWSDTTNFNEGNIGLIAMSRVSFNDPVSEE
jgi:hypothetical protein